LGSKWSERRRKDACASAQILGADNPRSAARIIGHPVTPVGQVYLTNSPPRKKAKLAWRELRGAWHRLMRALADAWRHWWMQPDGWVRPEGRPNRLFQIGLDTRRIHPAFLGGRRKRPGQGETLMKKAVAVMTVSDGPPPLFRD
jgi:hypothetical protein